MTTDLHPSAFLLTRNMKSTLVTGAAGSRASVAANQLLVARFNALADVNSKTCSKFKSASCFPNYQI